MGIPSLFETAEKPDTNSLFRGAQVLTAGGTISDAAMAVLTKPTPPDGSTAQPPIVEAGVNLKPENNPDASSNKKMWLWIGAGILLVGVLAYGFKK